MGDVETGIDSGATGGVKGKTGTSRTLPSSPPAPVTPEKETPGRWKRPMTVTLSLQTQSIWLCCPTGLHQVFRSLLRLLQQPEDHRVAEVQVTHGLLHGGGQRVRLQPYDRH